VDVVVRRGDPHSARGAHRGFGRWLLVALLRRLRDGRVVLVEGRRRTALGPPSGRTVEVRVLDRRAYRRALLGGSLGLGDSYADGHWDTDDLVGLLRIAARALGRLDRARRALAPVVMPWRGVRVALRPMTPRRARRDVHSHYDLSNELYAAFLDESMTYSCAVFAAQDMTLGEAQEAKLARICRKLDLGPADHVLEIGTGWGSFALHAASRYGCRVTTTTISEAQRVEALGRVRAAGLDGLIDVRGEDYRALRGRFGKLVSIEMIEAVGWRQLGTFMRRCGELLTDDGLFCLQAITMDARAYAVDRGARGFANTRIFPGGSIPSLRAILRETARRTSLRPVHLEEIGPHYAETLRRWRESFEGATERIAALGFDERFRRLWRFYLSFCEAGFRERRIGDVQLILAGRSFHGEAALLERASSLPEAMVPA
jgi:cyclopropane-fatty-acyl-phospholipid synthase